MQKSDIGTRANNWLNCQAEPVSLCFTDLPWYLIQYASDRWDKLLIVCELMNRPGRRPVGPERSWINVSEYHQGLEFSATPFFADRAGQPHGEAMMELLSTYHLRSTVELWDRLMATIKIDA